MRLKAIPRLAIPAALAAAAMAADPRLLNLVTPDVQVIAGVNVQQASTTPFGRYVLSQMQQSAGGLQQLFAMVDLDPARDIHECLIAGTGVAGSHTGLALCAGRFDVAKIGAAAAAQGVTGQSYGDATVYTAGSAQPGALAFVGSSVALAGDLESVRAALGRRSRPSSLPPALAVKVNRLSITQDAWVVSLVPLPARGPRGAQPPGGAVNTEAFQKIEQASGGIKFGSEVTITAEASTASANDAAALAGAVQLMANIAQLQAERNPQAAALARSVKVSAAGTTVTLRCDIPEAQFEELMQPRARGSRRPARR